MTTSVLLPEEAIFSMELEGQLEKLGRLRDRGAELDAFDRALKDIDPRLSLVRASEQATAPGLTPGYWHIRRQNDAPTMDSYLILTDPDGDFTEPHSGHLEWLRGCDLQRAGALDDLQKQQYAKERERQKARALLQEERMSEFATRYKALAEPGVSFGGTGWTARTKGRRGRA